MDLDVSCPIDHMMINENKVRITAFLVLLVSLIYVIAGYWILPVFLVIDFGLRISDLMRLSPLAFLSGVIYKKLRVKDKPVDRAPKRFAATIGLVLSLFIVATIFFQLDQISKILAIVLTFFAGLESIFSICFGCYLYSLLKGFKLISK